MSVEDESILSVGEGTLMAGVQPGEVTLTIHAYYGETVNSVDITIYVVE